MAKAKVQYGGMKGKPRREKHYGKKVWVSPRAEAVRRRESLCYNCANFKPGEAGECRIAARLYRICKETDVALVVARCPEFKQTAK